MAATATPETGDIVQWGGRSTAIPVNWLLCDGTAVSRTTYSALFTAIGTTFGAGDGSTTFNLPNSVARFARGNATPGGTGGTLNHTHSGASHSHTITQAATHSDHASGGAHTHDSHTITNNTSTTIAITAVVTAPTTHSSQGGHTHAGSAHDHSGATSDSSTPADSGTNNPAYLAFHRIIRT